MLLQKSLIVVYFVGLCIFASQAQDICHFNVGPTLCADYVDYPINWTENGTSCVNGDNLAITAGTYQVTLQVYFEYDTDMPFGLIMTPNGEEIICTTPEGDQGGSDDMGHCQVTWFMELNGDEALDEFDMSYYEYADSECYDLYSLSHLWLTEITEDICHFNVGPTPCANYPINWTEDGTSCVNGDNLAITAGTYQVFLQVYFRYGNDYPFGLIMTPNGEQIICTTPEGDQGETNEDDIGHCQVTWFIELNGDEALDEFDMDYWEYADSECYDLYNASHLWLVPVSDDVCHFTHGYSDCDCLPVTWSEEETSCETDGLLYLNPGIYQINLQLYIEYDTDYAGGYIMAPNGEQLICTVPEGDQGDDDEMGQCQLTWFMELGGSISLAEFDLDYYDYASSECYNLYNISHLWLSRFADLPAAESDCDATSLLASASSAGDCTADLASGSSCAQQGNAGYTCSASFCVNGVLTPGVCLQDCDASTLLANAISPGDCTANLASGETCTQQGKTGHTCTVSSCANGVLTSGFCLPGFSVQLLNTSLDAWLDWVDHECTTGDDRGGIAVSATTVLVVGDGGMAIYELPDVTYYGSVPTNDGIVSNLADGTVYSFAWNSELPVNADHDGWERNITHLIQMTDYGRLTNNAIELSSPIPCTVYGDGGYAGIFAGWNMILFWSGEEDVGSRAMYRIDLPGGTVTVLSEDMDLLPYVCENWAFWGIVEYLNGEEYVTYAHEDENVIWRTRARSNGTVASDSEIVARFNSISDMCSFSLSATYDKWFLHYEDDGDFNGTDETLAWVDMVFTGVCDARSDNPFGSTDDGSCTDSLLSGQTCQITNDAGYTCSLSTCNNGVLEGGDCTTSSSITPSPSSSSTASPSGCIFTDSDNKYFPCTYSECMDTQCDIYDFDCLTDECLKQIDRYCGSADDEICLSPGLLSVQAGTLVTVESTIQFTNFTEEEFQNGTFIESIRASLAEVFEVELASIQLDGYSVMNSSTGAVIRRVTLSSDTYIELEYTVIVTSEEELVAVQAVIDDANYEADLSTALTARGVPVTESQLVGGESVTTVQEAPGNQDSGGDDDEETIIIAVCVTFGVILIVVLVAFFLIKRKSAKMTPDNPEQVEQQPLQS